MYETFVLESSQAYLLDALEEYGLVETEVNSAGELCICAFMGVENNYAMSYNGQIWYVNFDQIPLEDGDVYMLYPAPEV